MVKNGKQETFNAEYAYPTGPNSGPVVQTDVTLGNLTVTKFAVGTATKVTFQDASIDGIMGLGFQSENSSEPSCFPVQACNPTHVYSLEQSHT